MMGASVDWPKRIYALQQLEGLVLGGAHDFDNFGDQLKGLRDALTVQLNDRCGRAAARGWAGLHGACQPPPRPASGGASWS
jgi:hypothetical protein